MSKPARTADASALFVSPAAAANSNAQSQQWAASGAGGADKAQQAGQRQHTDHGCTSTAALASRRSLIALLCCALSGSAWAAAVSQIAAHVDVDSECECNWNDAAAAAGSAAAVAAAKAAESTSATIASAPLPSTACQRVVTEVLSLLHSLRNGPSLPSHASYTAILELSRRSPALFRLPPLQSAVMQLLALSASSTASGPQPPTVSFHAPYHSATASAAASAGAAQLRRKSPLLPVLASALLDSAFRCMPVGRSWPTALAFALINDALEARSWCDAECCTHMVETITLAFRDYPPPIPQTAATATATDLKPAAAAASSSTAMADSDEEEEIVEEESGSVNPSPSPSPPPASSIVIPFTAAALAAFPAISIAAGMAALARTPVNTAAAAAALAPHRPPSTARTAPLIPRYTSPTALEDIRRHAEVMFVRACREVCGLPAEANTSGMKHYNAPAMATPKPATSVGPLLRFLHMTLGYRSMRHFATLNIEAWLNAQNSNRPAKRLLLQLTSEISARFIEEASSTEPATQSRLARLHPLSGLGPLERPWNELSQHISSFNAEVLHAWSRTGGMATPPGSIGLATVIATGASAPPLLDLQNARMLISMASRVRSGPGAAQQSAWDDAYLDSIARMLGAATGSSELPTVKVLSDASHYAAPTAPSIHPAHPMLWKVAFFSWLTLDWSHAISMQGVNNAAASSPSPAPPAAAGPLAPSALLQAPSHFVLRMLDVLLRCQPDGGLAIHLAQIAFSCLDRPDLMTRLQFVLRRVALLNTTALAASSNAGAAVTGPVARANPVATFMDFFQFITILLDAPAYPQHPHHVLMQLQEPGLAVEPFGAVSGPPSAAAVKAYTDQLSKFQLRRECAVTELVNLVVWSCIQATQPLLWIQAQVAQTGYERSAVIMTHTNQAIAAAAAAGQSALSQTAPAALPSLPSAASASAPSPSPLPSSHRSSVRPPLNFDRSLRTFRFAIADVHAKAMLWCQTWLCALLTNKPAPAGLPVGETAATQPPAAKDVNQLFSEMLTSLLFLHSAPQQFLAPFMPTPTGSAAAAATAASGPKPITKEPVTAAPTSFFSDLWPLDVSLLRKASTLLLDKLPLLEDTIARVVLTALAHPDKLPRAQAIQILEILLRRVCLLSLSVGKQYEQAASSGKMHTGVAVTDADEDETEGGSNLGLVRVQNDQLLEGILQLSQFPTPVPPPIPVGASHPPLLALSALFWRSCVLLVILSAFNPHTLGRKSWEAVPTLRCLLEMALSEIWLAPTAAAQVAAAAAADKSLAAPSSATAPASFTLSSLFPPFPDLITKSLLLHKQGVEIEAILFIENQLPDNNRGATSGQAPVPKVLRTRENSLYLSCNYLMLLEPSEILRRPPEHILQTLQKLCDDFQLGTLLRQSAAPNFLANMLQRQTPAQYVVWLRSLVIAEPVTLEQLPTFAITELLLAVMDRIQFEPVPSIMPAATETGLEEATVAAADNTSARRKNRGHHHHSSAAAGTASTSLSAFSDPILEHLPMLLSILRRTLPNLSHIYSINAKPSTAAPPTTSIMSVLSPSLSATNTADTTGASGALSTASAFFPSVRAQAEFASSSSTPFNQTAFLELLGLFLARLTSRTASVRRLATHALHFLLCPQNLPNTFAGVNIPCVCGSGLESSLNSSGSIPPLPPATCWLRFFFTWFLHSSDGGVSSAMSLSPSFVSAGRVVIHRVVSALMSALEIENDPDVLLGYMAFLHAIATRFSPDPPPLGAPSQLFCLDLALRVCDVVLAREIVTDKLMAPVRMQKQAPAASSTTAAAVPSLSPRFEIKRRKLAASSTDAANKGQGSAAVVPSSSQSMPALSDMPDFDLDQASTRGDAAPPSDTVLEAASAVEISGSLPLSGYAVMLSILSSAYHVVELMQDDEALIRRMLARGRAAVTAAAKGSRGGSKELNKPGMRRGSSNEMEDEIEEEEEIMESSSGGAPTTPQRGDAMEDAMAAPPLSRSLSVSDVPAGTSVGDEEFVTLHRSWPTCTKPILAYVPLPLLHGILDFLSFPYALPTPTSLQSSPALLAPFASYQHLLGVIVPEAPPEQLGHAVTIPEVESALPTLGITAGASWLLDSASIRWPLPSDLHASKLLAHSSTPILLLLAIEVCPPNQLLNVMMQFGLQPPIVRRMLAKLDAWAGYQLRLTQRQSGSAASSTAPATPGGLKASGSFPSGLSLSPGMREMLNNLDKLMHFVALYRSMIQREKKADTATGAMAVDGSSSNEVPGHVLASYLQSLAPPDPASTLTVQPSTPAPPARDSAAMEKKLLSSLRRMLSCTSSPTLPLLAFRRLCECAEQTPSVFLRLLDSAFDPDHAHLQDAWPLLCMVISDTSYVKDPASVVESVSTLRGLLPRMADVYAALSSESSAYSESAQLGSQSRVMFEEWRFACDTWIGVQTIDLSENSGSA